MSADVEFCLLGPLQVRNRGIALPMLPGKQRALLAALLLRANRMVPLAELTEVVWGSEPPATARATLRNYVKELRKTLAGGAGSRLGTVPGGYQFQVAADELDLARFDALLAGARASASSGAWEDASQRLRAGLSLWRGEPLADIPSEWLTARDVPRLAELRLQAIEAWIEANLQLGRHERVIAELRRLTTVHPFRERLHAQLMVALYRDGRQAEALAAFQRVRRALLRELGVEPGPDLGLLQQQILAADPALTPSAAPVHRRAALSAVAPVPRQLPALVPDFVGRAGELHALTSRAGEPGGRTAAVCAVTGTAGVGKTATVVAWAHQVADRFPDGQIYVDLRGYDPAEPLPVTEALAGFIRALGWAGRDLPAEAAERAALYRSLLSGRRALVLLDNARSAEQVRPMLPGTPGCAAVVTSRDALSGLVARDGAQRLELDVLPAADAAALLCSLIGTRAEADPGAVLQLSAECAWLPLALRVAAELAAASPRAPLAGLVRQLADPRARLDRLDAGGDGRTAVRTVLSWSCRQLDGATARAFRLLGLHPAGEFGAPAVAALTGYGVAQARRVLDTLAHGYLIRPAGGDHHGMHDLLRAYAAEQAYLHDAEPDRRAAIARLLGYYLRQLRGDVAGGHQRLLAGRLIRVRRHDLAQLPLPLHRPHPADVTRDKGEGRCGDDQDGGAVLGLRDADGGGQRPGDQGADGHRHDGAEQVVGGHPGELDRRDVPGHGHGPLHHHDLDRDAEAERRQADQGQWPEHRER